MRNVENNTKFYYNQPFPNTDKKQSGCSLSSDRGSQKDHIKWW